MLVFMDFHSEVFLLGVRPVVIPSERTFRVVLTVRLFLSLMRSIHVLAVYRVRPKWKRPFRNHDLEPVSERYGRYLAAAGRVALRNIERYLDTHPPEQQHLEMKVLEPKAWGEEFDLDEADFVEDPFGSVG